MKFCSLSDHSQLSPTLEINRALVLSPWMSSAVHIWAIRSWPKWQKQES